MQRPLNRALALASAVALAMASTAQAQVGLTSNTATVTLNATKNSTLTVSPATSTTTLATGIADNSNANVFPDVAITTAWNLTAGTSVNLVGWFGTPASALANGAAVIPSSKVEGGINGGGWTAFSGGPVGTVGVAGGSLVLMTQAVNAGNYLSSRNDNLNLRLNLVGFPTTTAGTYTGTLNLQAIVQ